MLKRTGCLVVVKVIDETQTLIEELLGLRVKRGNWMVGVPDTCDQRSRLALGMRCVLLSRGRGQAKKRSTEKVPQSFHLAKMSEQKIYRNLFLARLRKLGPVL